MSFVFSILIAHFGGLPGYSGIDQLEMSVLFQDIVILMSLASDWSSLHTRPPTGISVNPTGARKCHLT